MSYYFGKFGHEKKKDSHGFWKPCNLLDIFIQELEDNDIQDRADLDIIFKTILEGFNMQSRVAD